MLAYGAVHSLLQARKRRLVEAEEAKKIAFILKKNQDDVKEKFIPIRAFPASIKSMKKMINTAEATLEAVKKADKTKEKNPDREAKKTSTPSREKNVAGHNEKNIH